MLIRRAELGARGQVDLRCEDGRVVALAERLVPRPGEWVLDARGGAVLPGLHDHHLHLFASAAARASLCCGPPQVRNLTQLTQVLRAAPDGASWLRGVAYHESVAGLPDRWQLDAIIDRRPLRIQHRSGQMWLLNSAAVAALELDHGRAGEGVERDAQGRATGRLLRMDAWLGRRLRRLGRSDLAPSLTDVSAQLARCGVTGVTDAGVNNGAAAVASLTAALQAGQLRQKVLVLGRADLAEPSAPLLSRGAVKIVLDEPRLPTFSALHAQIVAAHRQARPVAIHCVTATELVFALGVLREAGTLAGDRIEHASVTPDDSLPLLREAGITVVTQPAFIYQRGDQYRRDVPRAEQPWLYRARCFLEQGIPLAGSSDAPYGDLDPWLAMRAAVSRKTRDGAVLGPAEALDAEQALALFCGAPERPGAAARRIAVGEVADLCVLDRPWQQARTRLLAADVVATLRDGEVIFARDSTPERHPVDRKEAKK